MWGALSDERTGLSFTVAAGPCQRSHSLVRAPLDSRPYFTVSDLRLPISSPHTTRRVTVEVFDPASTRIYCLGRPSCLQDNTSARTIEKSQPLYCYGRVFTAKLHSNGRGTDSKENSLCIMYPCLQFHCLETECITPFHCCVT
jgi:hypothetical protein